MRASTLPDSLTLPLAVVCHDAGGANQIIALLKTLNFSAGELVPVMQGPAASLWQRAFPEHAPHSDLRYALTKAAMLISGTGWASDLEHDARCIAHELGLRSVAVLDHWVNYAPRFTRSGHKQLPDALWVADVLAENMANDTFPETPVHRIPDYYLDAQSKRLKPVDQISDPHALFVCEPSLSDWGRDGPGEFQALNYFIDRLPLTDIPPGARILIRPHPSDTAGKYDAWIATQTRSDIALDTSPDIGAALANARWVAGCQSYAMVVALAAGRTVYGAMPPWAPACGLPHTGIRHLLTL